MKTNLENLNSTELKNIDGGWCLTPGFTPNNPWLVALLAAQAKGE